MAGRSRRRGTPEEPSAAEARHDLEREISRRGFLEGAGKAGLGVLGGLAMTGALAACGDDGKAKKKSPGGGGTEIEGAGDTLKIGVVGIFSGPFGFLARIIDDSLDVALREINGKNLFGRKVEVVKKDTGNDLFAGPLKAYNELAGDRDVVGILWFTPIGLEEARAVIARDRMPIVSAAADLYTRDTLYPEGKERSIFQILTPEEIAVKTLAEYCKKDRGYTRTALIYDKTLFSQVEPVYKAAVKEAGLDDVGIETHDFGASDFGIQLQRLKRARPEALFIWSLASETGGLARQLADLDASYVDMPTAKGPGWHPQIMGSPGGTGEKTWAENAGEAAKTGTLTPWYLGGHVFLPTYTMAKWQRQYLGKTPTGGEELAADALFTLLSGVKKAGTTDRDKVVTAIETMGKISFATLPFSFSKDRHSARVEDDFCLVTLERGRAAATDPPYELGKEFGGYFEPGFVGPTFLVRPRLEANRRAYPKVVDTVLEDGWGTQCTKKADGSLSKECKVH